MNPRVRRVAIVTAAALAALLLLAGTFVGWLVSTPAGARFAFARAQGFTGERLQARSVQGTLNGPLIIEGLAWRDAGAGVDFAAQRIEVHLQLRALLHTTVHVRTAKLEGLQLTLTEPRDPPEPQSNEPFSLQPPLDVLVDRLDVARAQVTSKGSELIDVRSAALEAAWTQAGVALQRLDVIATQGEVHFTATVNGTQPYRGEGNGRFRWRAGEQDFAGTMQARAADALASIDLRLTAPLVARLRGNVRQTDALPWSFQLDVPDFDPRSGLMPDSTLQRLAANLEGSGVATRGSTRGRVRVNQETIDIEALAFDKRDELLNLDGRVRWGGGSIQAKGDVQLAAMPVTAKMAVSWQDLVIPADLAGQVLNTRGALAFDGSSASYRANGNVTVGPPRRPADIVLAVEGTPELVKVSRLDVKQAAGQLAATGEVTLQPAIGWRFDAQAKHFDPGAFAAAWKGSLDLELETQGTVRDGAPEGQLVISQLRGTLRDRPVSGSADLGLTAQRALTGDLRLRSGESSVRVQGRGGNDTDAVITLDVASLTDWLPDAAGALRGTITAKGAWPRLHVTADLHGSELRYGESTIATLALDGEIDEPLNPSGNARLAATEVAAAGLTFATLELRADGSKARHSLHLDATGKPLSLSLQTQGSLADDGALAETIEQLVLDTRDVAHLTLQAPAQLRMAAGAASLSQACLADGAVRLCASGNREASGALQAKYELQAVPLALANAFLPASAALALTGEIAGSGNIARSAEGRLDGSAEIRSAAGRIAQAPAVEGEQPRVLLRYTDLALGANLNGEQAQLAVRAVLDDDGALRGAVSATGLGTPETPLRGELSATLPNLAVLEAFTTQLVNVKGRAGVRASIAGTLDTPQIDGAVEVNDFAADVLQVGLKLREGHARVMPRNGRYELEGGVKSGEGELTFDGNATTDGSATVALRGERFLAADIPGAKVVISPDLKLERSAQRMLLSGRVRLPSADINLQRLPRGNRAPSASDDVVIIDDAADMAKRAEATPLQASITIELGDQVKLTGYGLDATVAGQLDVRERPGEPTTGAGEIRVSGTYKAYGQDLTIRQGQLLYAATPLDNPNLSITAVRVVDVITAGFRVTGTAQSPQLAVFSDPSMGQSQALAYIVTGKSLDEIGQGGGSESDALRSAAQSLGTAAGGLLAKNLGKRLGVDEVGVKESSALGGSALTVGQYLSPRLYLSYGVGLFTPGEVITLRYKLTEALSLEAENASQSSRAGVRYKIER